MVEENNMEYLKYSFPKSIEKSAYNFWPRFAASQVFFSSILDILMAQVSKKFVVKFLKIILLLFKRYILMKTLSIL